MSKVSLEEYVVILEAAKGNNEAQTLFKNKESCFAYERNYEKIIDEKRHALIAQEMKSLSDEFSGKEKTDEYYNKYEELREKLDECYDIQRDKDNILDKKAFEKIQTEINNLNIELKEISSVSRGKTKIVEGKEDRYMEIISLLPQKESALEDCFGYKKTKKILFSKKELYEKTVFEIEALGEKILEQPIMLENVPLIEKVEKEYGISYYDVDALSATGMKKLINSPAVYKYFMEESQKKTKDFVVGQLLHCMVLEPDKVNERFMRMEFSGTTKEGKEERQAAKEKGLEPVNASDFDECIAMAEAILNDRETRKYFSKKITRHCEVEYYVKRAIKDIPISCKAKADQRFIMPDGSAYLLDVKTCKDIYVTPENVADVVFKYGYHIQAAWYLLMDRICNPDNPAKKFVFVFVSKEAPHLVTSFGLKSDWILEGRQICEEGMEIYADCIQNDNFPSGMPESYYELPMPEKYKNKRHLAVNFDEEEDEASIAMAM